MWFDLDGGSVYTSATSASKVSAAGRTYEGAGEMRRIAVFGPLIIALATNKCWP